MMMKWIVAVSISSALAAALPAFAQSPMPKDTAPAASAPVIPAPGAPAPTSPSAAGDPNVSYPLANGGTYQGPLTGQPDPTVTFYKGYNRT